MIKHRTYSQRAWSAGDYIQFETAHVKIDNLFLESKETLIVFTPAISESNPILHYFKTNNFKVLKRSEVLGTYNEHTNVWPSQEPMAKQRRVVFWVI